MTTGFTCGAWDLLHSGHLHFLQESIKLCDTLLVGLHTNPQTDRSSKNKPIQSTFERWYQLYQLNNLYSSNGTYKLRIIPYDTEADLENMLAMLPIHIRFLGSDYIHSTSVTGWDICKKRAIEIRYIPRLHNYSSSELRNRIEKAKI